MDRENSVAAFLAKVLGIAGPVLLVGGPGDAIEAAGRDIALFDNALAMLDGNAGSAAAMNDSPILGHGRRGEAGQRGSSKADDEDSAHVWC